MATIKDLESELGKLIKGTSNLETKSAGAGWDNALHPTAKKDGSPVSFAFLAYIHEYGSDSEDYPVPARKLFHIVSMRMHQDKQSHIKKIILTNLIKYDTIHISELLSDLANFVKSEIEEVMGDPNLLLSNADLTQQKKGGNTPLVDSGALKDNIIVTTGD